MVNIHISNNATTQFKSKKAITNFKTFLKKNMDTELIISSKYINNDYVFKFKEEDNNIYVDVEKKEYVWNNQSELTKNLNQNQEPIPIPEQTQNSKVDSQIKIKEKLKNMKLIRTGNSHKEIKQMKKNIDKDILEKYLKIYKLGINNSVVATPTEILDNPNKYRYQIEIFGSGILGLTKNKYADNIITDYFRAIAAKVGFEVMTSEKIQQLMSEQQPNNINPNNINPNNIDSDTEEED